MNFGERLKSIRHKKGLSQPELAEITGIEQSYLSKLENDKSLPSNDIFRRLLSGLELSLESFVKGINEELLRTKLVAIHDIEVWLNKHNESQQQRRYRFLWFASILIVLGTTIFYAGYGGLFVSETKYRYFSDGIVLEGEPIDVFRTWHRLIPEVNTFSEDAKKQMELSRQVTIEKSVEMAKRKLRHELLLDQYRGDSFEVTVDGGRRYYLDSGVFKNEGKPYFINALLQVLGVLLFSSGIMGFVLERKLKD